MWKKLVQYIKETKSELVDKTTWPTREAVLNSTMVVIVSIIIISLGLFVVDFGIGRLVRIYLIEQVAVLHQYFNLLSYLGFLVVALLINIIYNRIKSKFR